jgi:hypothetical protein
MLIGRGCLFQGYKNGTFHNKRKYFITLFQHNCKDQILIPAMSHLVVHSVIMMRKNFSVSNRVIMAII